MVVAVRTPPYGSWKDPAERIMSILNIGLQTVGLMRNESPYRDIEARLKKCNSKKEIRSYAEKDPEVKNEVLDSVKGVKDLLESVFSKLSLRGKTFKIFKAANENKLDELFSELAKIDPSVIKTDTTTKKIAGHPKIINFIKSHCVQRNYMFSVKKCELSECLVCDVPRLPPDVFAKLSHLPDPIPDGDHYKKFDDVYGTLTSEVHMPSLKEKIAKGHGLDYSPTGQTAKNTKGLLIQCLECQKLRVIYAAKTLKPDVRVKVERELESVWYTCGSVFADIDRSSDDDVLSHVGVRRNLMCSSPIETAYYTASYAPVCYHCGQKEDLLEKDEFYPICDECSKQKREQVSRRGKKKIFKPKP